MIKKLIIPMCSVLLVSTVITGCGKKADNADSSSTSSSAKNTSNIDLTGTWYGTAPGSITFSDDGTFTPGIWNGSQ